MGAISQYLRDTRAELRHVAWPTQTQTIIYTILIALISVSLSLYLGFFDFLFTGALAQVVNKLPASSPVSVEQSIATSTLATTTTTTQPLNSGIPNAAQ